MTPEIILADTRQEPPARIGERLIEHADPFDVLRNMPDLDAAVQKGVDYLKHLGVSLFDWDNEQLPLGKYLQAYLQQERDANEPG